jgi:hypothetical protein
MPEEVVDFEELARVEEDVLVAEAAVLVLEDSVVKTSPLAEVLVMVTMTTEGVVLLLLSEVVESAVES